MTMRAVGPFNGTLPEPTGILTGYLRDPKKFPYLSYTQFFPSPDIQFLYHKLNFDEPVRVPRENDFVWGFDDYAPTGRGFSPQIEAISDRVNRWCFPWQIGETTIESWRKAGFNMRMIYDDIRSQQFQVHRAWRAVNSLANATYNTWNTATSQGLLGTADPVYFNNSLGSATLPDGTLDDRFLVIKRTFNAIKRRINLATNGAVDRSSLVAVIPPVVAEAISNTHEIQEALKQSRYAKELTDGFSNASDWNIPDSYAGFKLIVEDTPRVKINQQANGDLADVTVSTEKDYILDTDTIYFVSRPGGLDGVYGKKSFSTLQMYHYKGEGQVQAFSDPKNELIEGRIVALDKFVVPDTASAFKLTDVLN